MAQAIKEHCNEHTQKQLAFNCLGVSLKYLSPAANSLEIRIAGHQVPKPRCLKKLCLGSTRRFHDELIN